jgi:hypothetical protein
MSSMCQTLGFYPKYCNQSINKAAFTPSHFFQSVKWVYWQRTWKNSGMVLLSTQLQLGSRLENRYILQQRERKVLIWTLWGGPMYLSAYPNIAWIWVNLSQLVLPHSVYSPPEGHVIALGLTGSSRHCASGSPGWPWTYSSHRSWTWWAGSNSSGWAGWHIKLWVSDLKFLEQAINAMFCSWARRGLGLNTFKEQSWRCR